jgi:AcrR family transcriptional regulator
MTLSSEPSPNLDRRVRRSRAALFAAAVRLVTERQTTEIPVSDLAEAADLSRRVVYQQFRNRDTLLLGAATDLLRREHLERPGDLPDDEAESRTASVLAMARHFIDHRIFYRTMLTGSCAYEFNQALCELFAPFNRLIVLQRHGPNLDPGTFADLTAFLTGGVATIVHSWIVDGADPLAPEDLTSRLARLLPLIMG